MSRHNKKGQATAELAIMGAVLLMVLSYLISQGYLYNCRQALEMYSFRKALQLSEKEQRGISLTVIRDIIAPSFFLGLNRQRLMATSIVEYNPNLMYVANETAPLDTPSRQLVQVNDAMIENQYFFEIPPTKIIMNTTDDTEAPEWRWTSTAVNQIDPQSLSPSVTRKIIDSNSWTNITENNQYKKVVKTLESRDQIPTAILFEGPSTIAENYIKDDWEGKIKDIQIDAGTIPMNTSLMLEETVRRTKDVDTTHAPH
ncbi:MAG: hypothetical protein PHN57_08145, partial [Candidatus Omnitrophica bacterium]|nr:hypothetical protein [Candidatus Omnitrophota bacterium]